MTTIIPIAASARPARVRSARRPRPLRPRFKKGHPATPQAVWPPFIQPTEWSTPAELAAQAAKEGHPLARLLALRAEAAAEIERLLAFLDQTELSGDEAEWDEPTDAEIRTAGECPGTHHDDDEPSGDENEPSLGAPEIPPTYPRFCERSGNWSAGQGDQRHWAAGGDDEREGDGCADDREDVSEDEGAEHDGREPSLGWIDSEAARGVYAGAMGHADLEAAAEPGIEVLDAARRRAEERGVIWGHTRA